MVTSLPSLIIMLKAAESVISCLISILRNSFPSSWYSFSTKGIFSFTFTGLYVLPVFIQSKERILSEGITLFPFISAAETEYCFPSSILKCISTYPSSVVYDSSI